MASVTPRALASGEIRWRVQGRHAGKMQQVTFLEQKGADQFGALVDRVGWPTARAVLEKRQNSAENVPTLREYTERYLDGSSGLLTGVERGTREGYRAEAERSFLQTMGEFPVDSISRADVGAWLSWQEKQPVYRDRNKPTDQQKHLSAKTVRNYHALLSAVLKSAIEDGLRTDNPAYKVRVSKGTKRENVFLSPDEFWTLMHFIPERHKRLVMFLAGTGCRWGEATALTWGDISLHGTSPTARITRAWKKRSGGPVLAHPKTSKSRRSVSLFPDLVASMGAAGASNEYVFQNMHGGAQRYGHFSSRSWAPAVSKAMDVELCKSLGLTPLTRRPTPHDMRHTHASWLIARGIPLPYIQVRLGHESITTTVNVYGHLVSDAHDQMASAIALTLTDVRQPLNTPKPIDS